MRAARDERTVLDAVFDRAPLLARLAQGGVHRVEHTQMGKYALGNRVGQWRLRVDRMRHLVVSQASTRTKHCRIERIRADLAELREGHLAHQRQPIDIGIERAQSVGDLLGQHRNHAPREIDRRTPRSSIVVEGVVRFDILADIPFILSPTFVACR